MNTGRDFYMMLGLRNTAQVDEILQAYKSLANEWHPDVHVGRIDSMEAEMNFEALAQAFQVLSNAESRAIYDQHGEGNVAFQYRAGRVIFNELFGDPFLGSIQDPPIKREFNVSLKNLYYGSTKKINITKHIHTEDGRVSASTKTLEIPVKAGWKAGTKITFQKEGDVRPNVIPADIVFILKEKPHSYFKREKDNLVYSAYITLKQALCGVKLSIPTLDGQQISIQINEPISPDRVHVISGKGLPNSKTGLHGDILVKFNIQFPTTLEKNQKEFIKSAFQDVKSWQ
jgi:DnaJ family protein B protein 4